MRGFLGQWVVLVVVLGLGGLGQAFKAQEIEVKQIRGQQAIVELPPELSIQPGQKLILKPEEDGVSLDRHQVLKDQKVGSRRNVLGLILNISYQQDKESDVDLKNFAIGYRQGLNFGFFEFGGELLLSRQEGMNVDSSAKVGGFFEINMIANEEPASLIPGVGLELYYGGINPPGQYAFYGVFINPNAFLKAFLGRSIALKGSLGYSFNSLSSRSSDDKLSFTDLSFNWSLLGYF